MIKKINNINNMRYAIVGKGFIYPRHKDAIKRTGGKVLMTCDIDPKKKADYLDFDLMLKSKKFKEVDIVVILTPNYLHFEMAKKVAELNKIVLVEKPIVLNIKDLEKLDSINEFDTIFTVLQLQEHPLVDKIIDDCFDDKEKPYEIEMDISVHRDVDYFNGWKGNKDLSGGILFNLGIHYFDLLLFLFGPVTKIKLKHEDDFLAFGTIIGEIYSCKFRLCLNEDRNKQRRIFKINDRKYNFSKQDNLSFENLHIKVYDALIHSQGTTLEEVKNTILLLEELKKQCQ